MAGALTIGQAAAYVGVTIKTVRHYHRLGLLAEPSRDTSGYRRYTSVDLLRLVQVRALADSGVPLADIQELLDADQQQFITALHEIEQQLDERIDALIARRHTLRRLAEGDRALLPEQASALLDRHTELGFPTDFVAEQRESLILARAIAPDFFEGYLTLLEHRLDDSEYVELQKQGWQAASWPSNDPRLDALASAIAQNLLTHRQLMEAQGELFASPSASARYDMLNRHRADELPTVARLTTLIEAHLREAGLEVPAPSSRRRPDLTATDRHS